MMTRMFGGSADRGPSTTLRGWLSDIYFPALLDTGSGRMVDALSLRLGGRAIVDDPIFGRTTGLTALIEHLKKTAQWLSERQAVYARVAFTTGLDRDATEGTLALTVDEKSLELPVAIVAERRREREVEVRMYIASVPIHASRAPRESIALATGELVLPQVVADHVQAIQRGDVDASLASFEADGFARDPRGLQFSKIDHALKSFHARLFGDGFAMKPVGAADDGRTCAIECMVTKIFGRDVPPQATLFVYERGDSGLVRALRVYGDAET